jgi:hypothetical protein
VRSRCGSSAGELRKSLRGGRTVAASILEPAIVVKLELIFGVEGANAIVLP